MLNFFSSLLHAIGVSCFSSLRLGQTAGDTETGESMPGWVFVVVVEEEVSVDPNKL